MLQLCAVTRGVTATIGSEETQPENEDLSTKGMKVQRTNDMSFTKQHVFLLAPKWKDRQAALIRSRSSPQFSGNSLGHRERRLALV